MQTNYYNLEFTKYNNYIKKTWQTINDVMQKSKIFSKTPEYFNSSGDQIKNNKYIANHFNNFFINIGSKITKNIDVNEKPDFQYYINKTKIDSVFHFEQISVIETQTIINKLKCKTSTGTDNVSQLLLKTLSHTLAEPLTCIINQSLIKGIFPNKLKIAKMIPIFKNGDQHDINNYRPISLLPSISKVFEKIVYNQIFQYFTINKLFHTNQYGFRAEHSTELALSEIIDRILLYLDQQKIPITIFIDLSKAFDTIDHSILISKMKHYGINNTELDWIKSYLFKDAVQAHSHFTYNVLL